LVALRLNAIHRGDTVTKLDDIDSESVDLVFADPPFNIGYQYDVYDDRRSRDEYLQWCGQWIAGVRRVLKPHGTLWLAIGDEFAAELKVLATDRFDFRCRSWVIWYYTFGVNCVRALSRSHTHLFHFVKDAQSFTFNADNPSVRVLSARQLVYADVRANSKGRLPDNTWILRPQDAGQAAFLPQHDTWYFARVAGTFKEREGFHGCQMPEQLLGRIIRLSSNPQDLVLDPFAGSGTTLAVAKKLGRQWLGIELSSDYVKRANARVKNCRPGDSLDGPADPVRSAPSTSAGKSKVRLRNGRPIPALDEETETGVIAAYTKSSKGYSADMVLCDPERNAEFIEACRQRSLAGDASLWNRSLLRIRKRGDLPSIDRIRSRSTLEEMDTYSHASEIALRLLSIDYQMSLDEILCWPEVARTFDDLAGRFAADQRTPFEYRWAALAIRKRAKRSKRLAEDHFRDWLTKPLPRRVPLEECTSSRYDLPGVFVVFGPRGSRMPLYVAETFNIRRRVEMMLRAEGFLDLQPEHVLVVPGDSLEMQHGLQSVLVTRTDAPLNTELLRIELRDAPQCNVVS
jgi:site-specific DNA-methyltransferase (adenine-specific)